MGSRSSKTRGTQTLPSGAQARGVLVLVLLILGWAFLQKQQEIWRGSSPEPAQPIRFQPQPSSQDYPLKPGDQWLTADQVPSFLSSLRTRAGDRHTSAEAQQLLQALQSRGVKILIENPNNRDSPYGGLWDPQYGLIKLTADQLWGIDPLVMTLAHESIHVAQSCHQGGLYHNAEPLGLAILKENLALVGNTPLLYGNAGDPRVEAEAYTYGRDPAATLRILEEYCPPAKAREGQHGS